MPKSPTGSIPNADAINYLNIGLMIVAVLVAIRVPFETFLFAYAVLGPAHYLTEISWLHQRNYFTKRKSACWLLGGAAIVISVVVIGMGDPLWGKAGESAVGPTKQEASAWIVAFALAAALALVVRQSWIRMICLAIVLVMAIFSEPLLVLFAVFVPTLVHVYVFTGLFILYGAMRGKSATGYASFGVFLLCPLVLLATPQPVLLPDEYVRESYRIFAGLNVEVLKIFSNQPLDTGPQLLDAIFLSKAGIVIMSLIAFAYTYHYLNWFSKTSIIKWHKVSRKRMAIIGLLWLAAVAVYAIDYGLGFKVLFCLSFLHVFLEFPLNHVTIMGIGSELKGLVFGASKGE